MKRLFILCILILTSSCQYFETEKISSETFYEEELKSIDWKDIDRYPQFDSCKDSAGKQEGKACFENYVSSYLYERISAKPFVAIRDMNTIVQLNFLVEKTGELSIKSMEMDSVLNKNMPLFRTWILESVDSLQPSAPAYKRGIPVKTEFTLPIAIKTAN